MDRILSILEWTVDLLFGFDLSLTFLLVLLINKLFLESLSLGGLLLQPDLFLNYELLLALFHIFFILDGLLCGKLFTQGMRFCVLALLHETLENLFVLKELA